MVSSTQAIQVGPWNFNKSEQVEVMSIDIQEHLRGVIENWAGVFIWEDTYVRRHCHVPSLLVRVDCVPTSNVVGIYEIEERPGGVGLTRAINCQFADLLTKVESGWPAFGIVVSPRRKDGTDDFLWRPTVNPETYQGALLIRADPDEQEFHILARRSVSSLCSKGDKSYGIELGWWKSVERQEELPWDEGFCLKPLQSSKCEGVHIFPPKGTRSSLGGSTRGQIRQELKQRHEMYCQPYIHPKPWDNSDGVQYFGIWRAFFGYDLVHRSWMPLGGVWNAVPNSLRVHGGKHAVFGPLVLASR